LILSGAKIRNVERNFFQKRTMRCFAPLIADELLPTRGCLKTITRKRRIKTKSVYALLLLVAPSFLLTIKKIYVKLVKERDT